MKHKPHWIEILACLGAFMLLSVMAMAALITGEISAGSPRTGQIHHYSGSGAFFIGGLYLALALAAIGYLAKYWRWRWLAWLGLGLLWGASVLLAWNWRLQFQ
jgi:MFS family permease